MKIENGNYKIPISQLSRIHSLLLKQFNEMRDRYCMSSDIFQ